MPGTVGAPSGDGAEVKLDTGVEVVASVDGLGERRPLPRRGPAGEAPHRRQRLQPAAGWPQVEGIVESSVFLGTSTQIVVGLTGDVRMTVLVPNADEAERGRLPGGGAPGEAQLGARAHARCAGVRE